jgi:hypothetical protein
MILILLHILPTKVVGGVSAIYSTMQSMQGKCLRTKQKHRTQFPLNPRNFSPIGIHCQNGQKNLEGQYTKANFLKEISENTCTYTKTIFLKEIKLYRGSKIANKIR